MKILSAEGIVKSYPGVKALAGVSLALEKGKTLGVVGESGSGKSTLARVLLKLEQPDSGRVIFEGNDFRRRCQIVFQEPFLSLDPRLTVRRALREPFEIHKIPCDEAKLTALLADVELDARFLDRLPRQMSGGECQRVALARALAAGPEVLVLDEAVSALDALVQVQILNLLRRLQKEHVLSYLFISHDLRIVRSMSDDVIVLKDGHVCEAGPRDQVFSSPKAPYTRALIEAFEKAFA